MRYVTYDGSGNLTGCYQQEVHPSHRSAHFAISDAQAVNWPSLRMNEARNALEFAPTAAPVATVPQSVPALDARLTLIDAGKMAAVKAYIAGIPGIDGERASEYFERAKTWRRDHDLVVGIPDSILTDAQKDELFIVAGALNA